MPLAPHNPATDLPASVSREKLLNIGAAFFVLTSRATDEELNDPAFQSMTGLIQRVVNQPDKPAPVKLSEAMHANASSQPSTIPYALRPTTTSTAQQLRDEEVIKAAKVKYGDDWNNPEARAFQDAWAANIGE